MQPAGCPQQPPLLHPGIASAPCQPPQTPREPGRDKVWGEVLQKSLLSRRQGRGKRVLAEEPQPPRASAVGEGMLSQQQGPAIQVHGSGTSTFPRGSGTSSSPACLRATVPEKRWAASGLRGGVGLAFHLQLQRTCLHTHAHTRAHALTHAPDGAFDFPYLPHRCEPASPATFAPCLRADLCPQVPRSPTSRMPLIPPQPSPDKAHAAR